jgi:hypothetical protein
VCFGGILQEKLIMPFAVFRKTRSSEERNLHQSGDKIISRRMVTALAFE